VNDEKLKGFGRNGHGLMLRYYPSIHLEELRKITKTSVKIAGLRAKI
jgi:hypothetical protein